MFWLIVGIVIVVGFALAWWTSGRARGRLRPFDLDRAKGETMKKYTNPAAGGISGHGGGVGS